jgi:hypothetical protein
MSAALGKRTYSMRSRRFSKSVAAAILAASMLAVGATAPADAATTDKTPTSHTSKYDTGWG